MSDYDESIEIEEEKSQSSDEYDEDEYYNYRKRYYRGFDFDYECKRCKTEDSYEFVTINPVTLTNVPKLEDMASVVVAASLWNHVNVPKALSGVRDRCTKNSTEWSTLRGNVIALIGQLPVPKSIADQINRYVRKMANEITAWVSYHYRTVFLKNGLDKFIYNLVYHIVWYPNGAIDCVQTARSMIMSLRLSDVEKLRFFCVYCLKDEIDEMSPLLFLNNVIDHLSLHENPLIFYWYCFYRDELAKIRETTGFNRNLSIDAYMLHHTKVDNWPAKEYFFDQLSYDEQVRKAIWLIDNHGIGYQKAVLLKLDETQRVHVYMERAAQIIVNYARPRVSSKFILQTWFEARNLMSPNQFLTLFQDLLKTDVREVVLTEIWTSASDNLKNLVICAYDYDIIRRILVEWKWREGSDFVFVLLHDSSATMKKSISETQFFNAYCVKLLVNGKFGELDRLLEFFLSDAENLTQFKMNLVNNSEHRNFNAHCETLLTNGKFQELEGLLKFCLSDTDDLTRFRINLVNNSEHVRRICLNFYSSGNSNDLNNYLKLLLAPYTDAIVRYKKKLLMSSQGISLCVSLIDKDSQVDILNTIFLDSLADPQSIAKYKKTMILSSAAITKLKELLLNNRVNTLQSCIDRYLTSDQDKNSLKAQLVGDVGQLIQAVLRKNDESYLQTVLIWWFGNVNAVHEFKRSLSLDSIFIDMLKECVFYEYDHYLSKCKFKYCQLSDFDVIERFLNWYFESPAKAKQYKMKVIHSHSKIDMFQTILRGQRGDNQLKTMLQWFFKNDAAEIAKFKMCGGKITRLI